MPTSNGSREITEFTRQFKLDQAEIERARATADALKSVEHERRQDKQQSLLEQMLTMQAAEAKVREERRSFWLKFVFGPTGLVVLLGGGAFGFFREPAPAAPTVETVEAAGAKASTHVEGIKSHIQRNEDKIYRIVEIQMDQQVEQSDSTQFLSAKIEAAHPRTKSVDIPQSVRDGREKSTAIKKRRAKKKRKYDPSDPFADLKEKETQP